MRAQLDSLVHKHFAARLKGSQGFMADQGHLAISRLLRIRHDVAALTISVIKRRYLRP